jgi:serine/threonine protein kinase
LYVAPELFEGTVTTASDIFSLGATIFEMATNITMPKNGNLWHVLRQGASFSLVANAPSRSAELEHLVKLMMDPVPSKRPTVDQILSYPILKSLLLERKLESMDEDISEGEALLDTRVIASRSALQKTQRREPLETRGNKMDEDEDVLGFTAIAPVNLMSVLY